MIVVKNEEWTKNIEGYEKRMEDARAKCEECNGCCDAVPCENKCAA